MKTVKARRRENVFKAILQDFFHTFSKRGHDISATVVVQVLVSVFLKDTDREKAPLNKTPTLSKSTNMGIWIVATSNQLFILGS